MILLWGLETDTPLCATRETLLGRGADVFFLDQSRVHETSLSLDEAEGEIRVGRDRLDLSDVTAIYLRCDDSAEAAPGARENAELRRHAGEIDAAMGAFLEATAALVVNPFEAMATNGSKPYQSALIRARGFSVPETLVTTDPAAARAFVARQESAIYKSVSAVRSIVKRVGATQMARLEDVAWCPTQFQAHVPGRDFRVHVIGDHVFASEIVSDADDYRYAGRQGESVDVKASTLDSALAGKCRDLAHGLGLLAAGVDLRLTPDGEWFCFEVNPSPAFTYYESATGQPMAEAMAELLIGGARSCERRPGT